MKKWLSIVLTALLCVALVGCAEQEKPADSTSTTSAPAAASSAASTTSTASKPAAPSHTTQPTVSPIFITEEDALGIAALHFGIEPGTIAPETGYVMSYRVLQSPTEDDPRYKVALQWLVMVDGQPSHQSVLDFVYIDAYHGQVIEANEG